jgi:NAD(P)-dependent dehydrogenase (short-subunit alcohol dehydrogenase family)
MNKVVIVTGGGRGIGAATSKLLAAQGYAVCVNYRADTKRCCLHSWCSGSLICLAIAQITKRHKCSFLAHLFVLIRNFVGIHQDLTPVTIRTMTHLCSGL